MPAKKIELGPTARAVALTITIHRATAGLTVAEFAERVTAAGRPLTRQAASEIEAGRRRVDVDDLVVIASVLGVSPATLLMPQAREHDDVVELTGTRVPAEFAWRWLTADADLDPTQTAQDADRFRRAATPAWAVQR